MGALIGAALLTGLVFSHIEIRSDMADFLPRGRSDAARMMLEELRSGAATSLVIFGIEGAPPDLLARISREMTDVLERSGQFVFVNNGGRDLLGSAEQRVLYDHRYLLSSVTTPEAFSVAALRDDMQRLLRGLQSSAVSQDKLATLMKVSRTLDDMLNRAPNRHAPYVGESAFVTKAGIHASAMLKDPQSYEHVSPEAIGNHRKVLVSDQAGRSNVIAELERAGIPYDKNDPKLVRLVEEMKEREAAGYAYENASASFDLLARRTLGRVPEYFRVEQFDVNVEQRYNSHGQRITVAMAVVKVDVAGETLISAAEGNGPVNALDVALRKDLGKYQKYIEGLKLIDYRVRILNGGTEAVTRVLIESEDEQGERWTTIGVSPNIIDASFQALMDSVVYKLVKSGAPA